MDTEQEVDTCGSAAEFRGFSLDELEAVSKIAGVYSGEDAGTADTINEANVADNESKEKEIPMSPRNRRSSRRPMGMSYSDLLKRGLCFDSPGDISSKLISRISTKTGTPWTLGTGTLDKERSRKDTSTANPSPKVSRNRVLDGQRSDAPGSEFDEKSPAPRHKHKKKKRDAGEQDSPNAQPIDTVMNGDCPRPGTSGLCSLPGDTDEKVWVNLQDTITGQREDKLWFLPQPGEGILSFVMRSNVVAYAEDVPEFSSVCPTRKRKDRPVPKEFVPPDHKFESRHDRYSKRLGRHIAGGDSDSEESSDEKLAELVTTSENAAGGYNEVKDFIPMEATKSLPPPAEIETASAPQEGEKTLQKGKEQMPCRSPCEPHVIIHDLDSSLNDISNCNESGIQHSPDLQVPNAPSSDANHPANHLSPEQRAAGQLSVEAEAISLSQGDDEAMAQWLRLQELSLSVLPKVPNRVDFDADDDISFLDNTTTESNVSKKKRHKSKSDVTSAAKKMEDEPAPFPKDSLLTQGGEPGKARSRKTKAGVPLPKTPTRSHDAGVKVASPFSPAKLKKKNSLENIVKFIKKSKRTLQNAASSKHRSKRAKAKRSPKGKDDLAKVSPKAGPAKAGSRKNALAGEASTSRDVAKDDEFVKISLSDESFSTPDDEFDFEVIMDNVQDEEGPGASTAAEPSDGEAAAVDPVPDVPVKSDVDDAKIFTRTRTKGGRVQLVPEAKEADADLRSQETAPRRRSARPHPQAKVEANKEAKSVEVQDDKTKVEGPAVTPNRSSDAKRSRAPSARMTLSAGGDAQPTSSAPLIQSPSDKVPLRVKDQRDRKMFSMEPEAFVSAYAQFLALSAFPVNQRALLNEAKRTDLPVTSQHKLKSPEPGKKERVLKSPASSLHSAPSTSATRPKVAPRPVVAIPSPKRGRGRPRKHPRESDSFEVDNETVAMPYQPKRGAAPLTYSGGPIERRGPLPKYSPEEDKITAVAGRPPPKGRFNAASLNRGGHIGTYSSLPRRAVGWRGRQTGAVASAIGKRSSGALLKSRGRSKRFPQNPVGASSSTRAENVMRVSRPARGRFKSVSRRMASTPRFNDFSDPRLSPSPSGSPDPLLDNFNMDYFARKKQLLGRKPPQVPQPVVTPVLVPLPPSAVTWIGRPVWELEPPMMDAEFAEFAVEAFQMEAVHVEELAPGPVSTGPRRLSALRCGACSKAVVTSSKWKRLCRSCVVTYERFEDDPAYFETLMKCPNGANCPPEEDVCDCCYFWDLITRVEKILDGQELTSPTKILAPLRYSPEQSNAPSNTTLSPVVGPRVKNVCRDQYFAKGLPLATFPRREDILSAGCSTEQPAPRLSALPQGEKRKIAGSLLDESGECSLDISAAGCSTEQPAPRLSALPQGEKRKIAGSLLDESGECSLDISAAGCSTEQPAPRLSALPQGEKRKIAGSLLDESGECSLDISAAGCSTEQPAPRLSALPQGEKRKIAGSLLDESGECSLDISAAGCSTEQPAPRLSALPQGEKRKIAGSLLDESGECSLDISAAGCSTEQPAPRLSALPQGEKRKIAGSLLDESGECSLDISAAGCSTEQPAPRLSALPQGEKRKIAGSLLDESDEYYRPSAHPPPLKRLKIPLSNAPASRRGLLRSAAMQEDSSEESDSDVDEAPPSPVPGSGRPRKASGLRFPGPPGRAGKGPAPASKLPGNAPSRSGGMPGASAKAQDLEFSDSFSVDYDDSSSGSDSEYDKMFAVPEGFRPVKSGSTMTFEKIPDVSHVADTPELNLDEFSFSDSDSDSDSLEEDGPEDGSGYWDEECPDRFGNAVNGDELEYARDQEAADGPPQGATSDVQRKKFMGSKITPGAKHPMLGKRKHGKRKYTRKASGKTSSRPGASKDAQSKSPPPEPTRRSGRAPKPSRKYEDEIEDFEFDDTGLDDQTKDGKKNEPDTNVFDRMRNYGGKAEEDGFDLGEDFNVDDLPTVSARDNLLIRSDKDQPIESDQPERSRSATESPDDPATPAARSEPEGPSARAKAPRKAKLRAESEMSKSALDAGTSKDGDELEISPSPKKERKARKKSEPEKVPEKAANWKYRFPCPLSRPVLMDSSAVAKATTSAAKAKTVEKKKKKEPKTKDKPSPAKKSAARKSDDVDTLKDGKTMVLRLERVDAPLPDTSDDEPEEEL